MFTTNTRKPLGFAARTLIAASAFIMVAASFGEPANAQSGIRNTRHNLSSSNNIAATEGGTRIANKSTAGEICVFCHTPHGAASTAAAPIWNKKLADPATYTAYTSTTLDSTIDLTNSVSLACLTCHDGTQAMDTVLNAPGSGGYNSNGATMGVTWSGSQVGADGKLSATAVTNLGSDLSNDHPVGVVYANYGGNVADADFIAATQVGTTGKWYVESGKGNASAKDKKDMILYTKADSKPYVECASCHDPHTDENPTFLRIANTGSAVCLTCHNK